MTSAEIYKKRDDLIWFDGLGVPHLDGRTARAWRRYADATEDPVSLVAAKIVTYLEIEHHRHVNGGKD